jgi:hypothetical protein
METRGDGNDSEQLAEMIVHLTSPHFVIKVTIFSIKAARVADRLASIGKYGYAE